MHFVTPGARGPAPVEKLQAKKKIDDGWYNVYHQRMVETGARRTIFEKIWSRHVVAEGPGAHVLLYIDRHLLHEGSTSAFGRLAKSGRGVRRPDLTFATADHYVLTTPGSPAPDAEVRSMVESLGQHTGQQGIVYFGVGDARRGIVHIIGPEQGLTLPGITLVCGDSHTATHGAFGALAFGIGSTEVEHVMATQTLWQKKPKVLRITVEGRLPDGVNAKDVILAIIARIGAGGGVGHAVEYAGSTIRAMSMDERMTVCNMSIEAGARAGMVAPDETTFAYLQGRPFAPRGDAWGKALTYWEMAASMVLRGALDADLFLDSSVEGILIYAKFHHFHAETEKQSGNPFMGQTAALIAKYPAAKTRYEAFLKNFGVAK